MSSPGPVLITGGAGFIGCNLADRLCEEGHRVRVYDALSRDGVESNLEWLTSRHGDLVEPVIGDVRDSSRLEKAASGIAAAFHFAAQVAVTSSMIDPRADLDINIVGTFNLLEAVRAQAREIPVIFASTNKVYGDLAAFGARRTEDGYVPLDPDLARHGVGEAQPLDFHTPYGCSKGAADQYVLEYARSYRMPTVVLRMSCIYGERQMGTEDQGWVAHFLIRALEGCDVTIFGDGYQVRDILQVSDAVAAYLAAWRNIKLVAGQALNLGGGPENAVSLRQVIEYASQITGRPLGLTTADWRPGDQRWFVSDTRRIRRDLELGPPCDWRSGVAHLAYWLAQERNIPSCALADRSSLAAAS